LSKLSEERTKLTANWLNAIASGMIVTGGVAPVIAAFFNIPGPSQASYGWLVSVVGGCLFVGGVLHFLGRMLLRSLDP
jgi:hypothetical protein